jgi:hypothetical protein
MKHLFKTAVVAVVIAASFVTLSSFLADKKAETAVTDAYTITLCTKITAGTNTEWTWQITNPNPGNGQDGTLQDISHWSVPLNADAEAALVSAQYSFDGVTWYAVNTSVDRDPSIRACTTVDVLKYDMGTTGSAPTYYRATFSQDFVVNPFAKSWVKTGGGLQGCNLYYFSGMGSRLD